MREGRRDGVTASGEAAVVHLPKGKSEAAASAARYIPKPKTVCVPRLLMELKKGLGVFHDATPAPIAGCRMSNGAITVAVPMTSAGSKEGDRAHSKPCVHSKSTENATPIE